MRPGGGARKSLRKVVLSCVGAVRPGSIGVEYLAGNGSKPTSQSRRVDVGSGVRGVSSGHSRGLEPVSSLKVLGERGLSGGLSAND